MCVICVDMLNFCRPGHILIFKPYFYMNKVAMKYCHFKTAKIQAIIINTPLHACVHAVTVCIT